MDDLMTARLSRFLNSLIFWGGCLGWVVGMLCIADHMRCADGGCWMTDAERELWKWDGRVVGESK